MAQTQVLSFLVYMIDRPIVIYNNNDKLFLWYNTRKINVTLHVNKKSRIIA